MVYQILVGRFFMSDKVPPIMKPASSQTVSFYTKPAAPFLLPVQERTSQKSFDKISLKSQYQSHKLDRPLGLT